MNNEKRSLKHFIESYEIGVFILFHKNLVRKEKILLFH